MPLLLKREVSPRGMSTGGSEPVAYTYSNRELGSCRCVRGRLYIEARLSGESGITVRCQSTQNLLSGILSAFERLVRPHVAPISVATTVRDSNFIQVAVNGP